MKSDVSPVPIRLLLVDDDRNLVESMAEWLESQDFPVYWATDLTGAKKLLEQQPIDVALIDVRLGNEDGFDLLRFVSQRFPQTTVVMMTGYAQADSGIEAIKAGAFDLLTKPLIDEELMLCLDRALSQQKVLEENRNLQSQLETRYGLDNIIGSDSRMRRMFEIIDSVADTRTTLLITGESGTGKSLLARAVHRRSQRRNGPFIEVACGALPENLLESELFGHVAGAFTGASANKEGKFQLASGGTLFLDEIGTASPALQVKLLRVLQEFEFEQVGGTKTFKVDTRVVLATNEDLSAAVAAGRFRQDLYYRINIINLQLPSLAERTSDIPALAAHFLDKVCRETGRRFHGFEPEALNALQSYRWPGNIRELQNVIERAVLLGKSQRIALADLPPQITLTPVATGTSPQSVGDDSRIRELTSRGPAPERLEVNGPKMTLKEALEGPERQIILQSLRANNWSRNATADQLGINRTTLYKKMRKLGLETPGYAYTD